MRYTEFGLSHMEVPGHSCLCIYISGCQNNCWNCHYPELQSPDNGELLSVYFTDIINLYEAQTTCVCFMGEGAMSEESKKELSKYALYVKTRGLKSCLYSGRDVFVEKWMQTSFDYVKTGSYKAKYGSLYEKTTNQHLYQITDGETKDITELFWK